MISTQLEGEICTLNETADRRARGGNSAMTGFKDNNAPRRYFVDAIGRRVLIGLTPEETFEFERLDSSPNEGLTGAIWMERGSQPDPREQRWLELYAKHEDAWKVWMAQSRVDPPHL